MNYLKSLSWVKGMVSKVSGSKNSEEQSAPVADKFMFYRVVIRYIVRLLLLLLVLFIFIWWPVDSFATTEGFDAWSTRMKDLPATVWGLISTILIFWATGEIMAARSDYRSSAVTTTTTTSVTADTGDFLEEGDDFLQMGELDGRFANVLDDDMDDIPLQDNPIIEAWKSNASE